MPRESRLWELLRSNLPKTVHWQRIEGIRGVPDTNGCYEGSEFWIEGKVVRSGFVVKFQPGQVPWLMQRADRGGRCFVLVRHEPTGQLLLYPGHLALELSNRGVRVEPWLRLEQPWDYDRLLEALTGLRVRPRRPRHKPRDPNAPLPGQRAFAGFRVADVA